jgi:tRNA-specific 2-thiouridylase
MTDGREVGKHDGFARYTVGQRRGLPGGFGEPMFVVRIDPDRRAIVIGPREALAGHRVVASEVNWLGPRPSPGDQVLGQIRHRSAAAVATIIEASDDSLEIVFAEAVLAIAPGQSLVIYGAERVLGGGIIESGSELGRRLPIAAA